MDIGAMLQRARERRDLSVEELSATTKIPVTVLRSIEAGDFDRVPGGIFARGFLRAVSRELGLDPEAIVAQYVAELERGADLSDSAGEMLDRPLDAGPPAATRRRTGHLLWLTVAAVAWILLARGLSTSPAPELPPVPQEVGSTPLASPTDAAPQGPVALAAHDMTVGTGGRAYLRITIQPHGDCWIEAVADGGPAVRRLMREGDRELFDVEHELLLRVGDPAAFAFVINGRPGRPLGAPATPVTVRITPDNYEELLAVTR